MSTVLKIGNIWICQCLALGCNLKEFEYQGKTYKGIGRSAKSHNAHQKKIKEINIVRISILIHKILS